VTGTSKRAAINNGKTVDILLRVARLRGKQKSLDYPAKYRSVLVALRDAEILDGQDFRVVQMLATYLHKMNDYSASVDYCERSLRLCPDDIEARQVLVDPYVRRGNLCEALKVCEDICFFSPRDPFAHINKGALQQKLGEYKAADESYRQASRLSSSPAVSTFFLKALEHELGTESSSPEWVPDCYLDPSAYVTYRVPRMTGKAKWRRRLRNLVRSVSGGLRQRIDKNHFQLIACPLCGSKQGTTLTICHGNGWRIERCRSCSLTFTNPQPDESILFRKYQDPYYDSERLVSARNFHRNSTPPDVCDKVLFDWLERTDFPIFEEAFGPKRSLLDVGCGTGIFLREMTHRNWRVQGLDVSRIGVECCRESGLDVRLGTLREASFEAGSFDLVSLHHVIEHVFDPVQLLRDIHELLVPGGRILV